MPEHLRALVVILALAALVFACAKKPVCYAASQAADFARRRNVWFLVTLAAFFAHNFWLFIVCAGSVLFVAARREWNPPALFFLVLFAVPQIRQDVPGLGPMRYFFTMDYVRLLAVVVLLPAFLRLRHQPDVQPVGRPMADKLLLAYLALNFVLILNASTVTHALRQGLWYAFIDVFLPYYVASRALKDLNGFRDALAAFVVAGMVLCAIGPFEYVRHWLLYQALSSALGVPPVVSYLERGEGSLRALASTGHAIPLGYVIAVAAGFYLYLKKFVPPRLWWLGLALIIAGLVSPLSRGPWVGAAAVLLVYILTGPGAASSLAKLGLAGVVLLPGLLFSPAGQSIIDHLPFVGTVAEENISYRELLLKIAIGEILKNPLFGSYGFMYSPEMQELRQGQGIIDIVNTYIGVALASGLVGLTLFAGFFLTVGAGIVAGMKKAAPEDEAHRLGQALLAALAGILIIIFTASSIFIIPVVYWSVAGLAVAYARMLAMRMVSSGAAAGPSPGAAPYSAAKLAR